MVQLDDEVGELIIVSRLVLVEFDDALLEDVEEGVDAVVVGLLLEASGEARVDRHTIDIQNIMMGQEGQDQYTLKYNHISPLSRPYYQNDPLVLLSYRYQSSSNSNTYTSSLYSSSYWSSEFQIITNFYKNSLSLLVSQTCYPLPHSQAFYSTLGQSLLSSRESFSRWCLRMWVTILLDVLNWDCIFLWQLQTQRGVLSNSSPRCYRKDSQTSMLFIRYERSSLPYA